MMMEQISSKVYEHGEKTQKVSSTYVQWSSPQKLVFFAGCLGLHT